MSKYTALILCTIFWFTGDSAVAQTPTAVISPEGYNASLGSTVTFNCNVNGTTSILWRVDGETNTANQNERGIFTLTDIEESNGTITGRLEVSATENNNNIEISCIAVSLSAGGNGFSDIAMLQVQGLLEPPGALEITNQGGFTQRLGWTIPTTLDLTDVDPDISYYNVCSTILSEQSCRSVQETEYEFLNVRMGIEFTVSAVNVVGQGNASTVTHTACDSATAPVGIDASEASTTVSLQSSGTIPTVSFSFEKDTTSGDPNCFNLYRIEAAPFNQGAAFTQGPMIPSVNGAIITLNIESGLARNTVYSVTLVSVNINGEASSTGVKQFSTYDVQSIDPSARPGAIAVTCTFTTGSMVDSCVVEICQVSSDIVTDNCQSLTVPRNPSSDVSTQQLSNLQPGNYTITEASVSTGSSTSTFSSEDLGYHLQMERIEVVMPPPTTTTSTPSTGPTQPISPSPSSANAGIIAGSVIGALVLITVIIISILLVYLCLCSRAEKQNAKTETVGLTTTEMWLESTDGSPAKRLTTIEDPPPPYPAIPGPTSGDPNTGYTDMAVIQGTNGHHVEIDLTDNYSPDELQMDSVELTETTNRPASPPYDTMDPSRPDILQHNTARPTSGGPDLDRLTPDDIHEVKLAASLDNLTKDNTRSTDQLIGAHSVDSLNSKGQYAVIDHRVAKKSKKPKDSDLVLYSEIKMDELRPVVPQKKRNKGGSSTGSLREEPRLETFHV